jgi:hypothetical protein
MGSQSAIEIAVPTSRGPSVAVRTLQGALCLAGVTALVFAWTDSSFRDSEGLLRGSFCLPLSAGAALFILAGSLAGKWRRWAFWFVLCLLGQAVSLQLIDAGKRIHYQHYLPFSKLLETHAWLMIFVLAQAICVLVGLRRSYREIQVWLQSKFRRWAIAVVFLGFTLSSATLSRNPWDYLGELVFAAFLQFVNLGAILLMAQSLPEQQLPKLRSRLQRLLGENDAGEVPPVLRDRFVLLAALWVTVVAGLLSYYCYQNHPHIPDEVAYLYEARYFAAGYLGLTPPPVPEAFKIYLIDQHNREWFASPPPGWPAILALGVLMGVPWLVNPVLAGINVILAYVFLKETFSRTLARVALLLLCVSPWHVFMAMNFMTHTLTLTCALSAAVALIWCRKTGRSLWAWLAGCATGVASLIRPLDGLLVAGLLGLWAIGLGGRRLRLVSLAAFVLGTVLTGALVLPYNKHLTGNSTTFPLNAYLDKNFGPGKNDLGFGANRGLNFGGLDPLPGHGPADALVNANLNLFSLNIELYGWATGSLLLPLLMICSGQLQTGDYIVLAVIGTVALCFSLYWFSGGPDFGARYWYLMLIPFIALTVRGIQYLQTSLNGTRVLVTVLSLCALTLLNYFPWRAIDKYYHYLRMRPDVRELAKEHDFRKDLIFVRGPEHPDYSSAWIYNPLRFNADEPLYVSLEHCGKEVRSALIQAYPDRAIWLMDGPTVTGAGFRLVGRITPVELLKGDYTPSIGVP